MFCWCCLRHLQRSSAFFFCFVYVPMISFSFLVSFLPFFSLDHRIYMYRSSKRWALHFPKCVEFLLRRVCHSNVTLCVPLGRSGEGRSSRLLCGHCYMVPATIPMCGVVTHGRALGSGHPALTCEPPGWPVSGWPHCDSACSDSGLRVPCLCRCVLSSMARFFSSMLASLLPSL